MANTRKPKAAPVRATPARSTPARGQLTRRRRNGLVGGLSGLAVLGLVGLGTSTLLGQDDASSAPAYGPHTVTIPGDLDGDNTITDEERKEAQTAQEVAVGLSDKLLAPEARRNVTTLLVTPPGEDWWRFTTSFISEIKLYDTDPPQDVNWYAVTWAKKAADRSSKLSAYPMLHVAFADNATAGSWAGEMAGAGRLQVAVRDNVVSLAPLGVATLYEKLPQRLGKIADVKQTTGYWSIDYSKKIALEAGNSDSPNAYRTFWQNLGFAGAQWTAVAREPDRWVGKITGWDSDQVDLLKAAAPLSAGATEDRAAPLQPAADAMYVGVGEKLRSEGPASIGQQVIVPSDTEIDGLDGLDLMLVLDNAFMGAFDGSGWIQEDAPFPEQVHWIFGDTMVVEMRTRAPRSSDDEKPAPVPDGPGAGTGPAPDQPGEDTKVGRGKRGDTDPKKR